jgi:acetylornithine deacetylase/succinyl-diaminopimelate desuccinylase-like protein
MMEVPRTIGPEQNNLLHKLVGISSVSGKEGEIMEYLGSRFDQCPDCRVVRQPVGPNEYNLIVKKGTGAFNVLLLAHVDMVEPSSSYQDPFTMISDHGVGTKKGAAIYDMKSGVMTVADYLERGTVPDGVTVIGAFVGDEERNSRHAKVLRQSDIVRDVDLILSPEIATLQRQERDYPKDVVIGRRGNLKSQMTISVSRRVHGAVPGNPNAIAASREGRNHLMDKFAAEKLHHPHFDAPGYDGEELEEIGEYSPIPSWLERPRAAQCNFLQYLVAGNSVEQALEWQRDCVRRLAGTQEWARKGIECVIDRMPERTSYDPYFTDPKDPLLTRLVLPAVDEVYGAHALQTGRSTADTCLFDGFTIAEIGPVGGNAHDREWVSEESLARTLAFYHHLLTNRLREYLQQ